MSRIPAIITTLILIIFLSSSSEASNNIWPWNEESSDNENARLILDLVCKKDPYIDIQTLWNQEATTAGKLSKEPFYLPLILNIMRDKIMGFMDTKQANELSKEELNKQAYSLLFVMMSYFNITPVAESAAISTVRDASLHSLKPYIRSVANSSSTSDFKVILSVSLEARRSGNVSALSTTIDTAKAKFRKPLHTKIEVAIKQIIDNESFNTYNDKEKARIIYSIANKVFLLEMLQNFDDFLDFSFNTAMNELGSSTIRESVFATQNSWKNFKNGLGFNFVGYLLGFIFNNNNKALEPWVASLDELANSCADTEERLQ
ncbi:MAG: hypothetical protein AB8G05_16310 [Oligoflexales bacterium]